MDLTHSERLTLARAAIGYLTELSDDELARPVPNCPEWTVYNAVVHVGRSAVGWREWIRSTPGDPTAFQTGAAVRDAQPSGVALSTLAQWANEALAAIDDDPTVVTYYPLAGEGTHGMWGLHAASEWGVHRLDVEDALGHQPSMTDAEALDALRWTVEIVLPALAARSGAELPPLEVIVTTTDGTRLGSVSSPKSFSGTPVSVEGPGVQVLLAVWGRPHTDVRVSDPEALQRWSQVPGEQAQFGAWD